jgi:hypothetical protein
MSAASTQLRCPHGKQIQADPVHLRWAAVGPKRATSPLLPASPASGETTLCRSTHSPLCTPLPRSPRISEIAGSYLSSWAGQGGPVKGYDSLKQMAFDVILQVHEPQCVMIA